MPRFFFDLFYDRYVVLDPGGTLFEYPAGASAAADELARELRASRSELRDRGIWIRDRDERSVDLAAPAHQGNNGGAAAPNGAGSVPHTHRDCHPLRPMC
jgi:hypothetical protein